METTYPYRVAWHKPKAVEVSSESRRAILEALEYEFPTSRQHLVKRCGLSESTFRHGYRQLIRERILALKYGPDPDSGKSCDLLTPACYPVLPVLELSETYMIWRLCSTLGESVFATVRDRGGFCSAEDDLHTLMGQVSAILRAGTCRLPEDIPLQTPVLLLPSPMNTPITIHTPTLPHDPERLTALVRRVLDQSPSHVLTPEEAVAHELGYHPLTRGASCVLHLRFGVTDTATLLVRENSAHPESPLVAAPYAAEMNRTLQAALQEVSVHSAAWQSRVADFLRSICRFITPQLVAIEAPDTIPALPHLGEILPAQTTLQWTEYALNTPSLAHKGALRYARRALWESMISKSPKAMQE